MTEQAQRTNQPEPTKRNKPRLSLQVHGAGLVVALGIASTLGVVGCAGFAVLAAFLPDLGGLGWVLGAAAGVVALATIGVVIALGVVICRRVQPLEAIDSALSAYTKGEREGAALGLGERFGDRASAWNGILSERHAAIEERKRAEAIVAISDRRTSGGALAEAFDALRYGVLLLDEHGLVSHVNGASAVMLGSPREQILNRLFDESMPDPELAEQVKQGLEGTAPEAPYEIERGEGTERSTLRFSVRPMRKDDASSVMVVIEDVTQQRLAEEARNGFVAQATHELRTPLTNIRLYVEEAIEMGEEDPVLRARALQVINTESRRLERVVADMLSVSEIEAGTLTLRPGEVRLSQVFEELIADFRPQAEAKEIKLSFDLPPKYPVAWADRDKLVLGIHNLVGNAIKYTPDGGSVTVCVEADDSFLQVEVTDTGIGIDPVDQKRIFDRFYRASDGRVADITGTGLGLSLARDVVRLHGGDITLVSEVDHGSTFTLRVPIQKQVGRAAA